MILRQIFTITIFLAITASLSAQKGILKGKIFDKSSGETIIGAIVEVKDEDRQVAGAATDFDGNYFFELEPGKYSLSVNYLSYANLVVQETVIEPRQSLTLDLALEPQSVSLGEIIVKADAVRSTEVALIALQRNAASIQDGVSSQQISRTGSTNAADAVRQLPAATLQDGRFIVMRGLGDRYTVSQLNNVTLPSTDPYRNSTSLDLVPGSMIESIVSVKSFTPDLPGNFSGGLININTKSIPDKFNLSFGIHAGYNSQNQTANFLKHGVEGKYDWLGFADKSRAHPSLLFDPETRNELSTSTYLKAREPDNEAIRNIFHSTSHALSNSFIPRTGSVPFNSGLNLALGHRLKVFIRDFGFTFSLHYSAGYQHYDEGIIATYINTNTDFLFPYQKLTESKSVQNPALGGLFNMAYKISDNHLISSNIIFNNDAEIIARSQRGEYLGQVSNSSAEFNTRSLEFIQRQLASYQLSGKHVFPQLNGIKAEWNASTNRSFQNEPDLRYFAYTKTCEGSEGEENCEYYINNSEIAYPYHFFRHLKDRGYEGKLDITIPISWGGGQVNSNSIKIGGLAFSSYREFSEYRYQLNNNGVPSSIHFNTFNGDFDAFLNPGNFGIIDTLFNVDGSVKRYVTGYHYINQINARNFYTGTNRVIAAYAMGTYQLTPALKAIGGIRFEHTNIQVASMDTLVPKGNIDQADLLYSLNLIYALTEKSNLRFAGTQTLARPNLRELAPFVQFDTKNGFFNVGNPELKRTLIQNFDARYELYPQQGELVAISAFYKIFENPIIRAFNPRATIPELSYINVDKAMVTGVELELRKELNVVSPLLTNFFITTNLAWIHSSYKIPAAEIANSKNIDPEYDQTERPFQGQAPYVVNAIMSYVDSENGLEVSLAYNISGRKLYNVSLFATPDVYEEPVSLLNFKASMRIARNFQLSFTARNILNAENNKIHTFNGKTYIAESYAAGRTLGAGLTYQIR